MTPETQRVVTIVTGSTSDNPRIEPARKIVQDTGIKMIRIAMSAHRTPRELEAFAKALPYITLSPQAQELLWNIRLRASVVMAAAGAAAHLGGALAAHNPAFPFIALPVASSATETVDSTYAMWNMPPGVPTLLTPTNKIAGEMAVKMHHLILPDDFNTIAIDPTLSGVDIDQKLLDSLGIQIGDSPIFLSQQELQDEWRHSDRIEWVGVIIPTHLGQITEEDHILRRLTQMWFYVGVQNIDPKEKNWGKIDPTNAVIAAAQIIAQYNPEVAKRLVALRKGQHDKVVTANADQERAEVQALLS